MLASLALAAPIAGLVVPSRSRDVRGVSRLRSVEVEASQGEGLHGSNFCFMPLEQLDDSVQWPRILRIAGSYPGVTTAELAATPGTIAAAAQGLWAYEFPDAHSSEYGMIAVPGSDLVQYAIDPVVVVASSASLGIPLLHENEVLAVIDRGAVDFSERSFFAFRDPHANLVIRRFDQPEPGWTIAGKLVVVLLPFDERTSTKTGTWLEEGDVSM